MKRILSVLALLVLLAVPTMADEEAPVPKERPDKDSLLTPLQGAIFWGNTEEVKKLVADPEVDINEGTVYPPPLVLAVGPNKEKSEAIVDILLDSPKLDIRKGGREALKRADFWGYGQLAQRIFTLIREADAQDMGVVNIKADLIGGVTMPPKEGIRR